MTEEPFLAGLSRDVILAGPDQNAHLAGPDLPSELVLAAIGHNPEDHMLTGIDLWEPNHLAPVVAMINSGATGNFIHI